MSLSNRVSPMPMQPALSRNVVDVLRGMVARGALAPGEHLKEVELANALGVSRGPIREALLQLANEGYVELRRHRGAYVRTLTRDDVEEVYSLRLALERLAVARAAERMSDELLARMDDVLSQMRNVASGVTPEEAVELDLGFHDLIYAAAAHERLERSWQFIRSQVAFFLNVRNTSYPDFEEVGYAEHKVIRDVLARRDPQAAALAIEEHLNGAYHRLLAATDAQGADRDF